MKTKMNYSYKIMPTVVGKLKLIASDKGLAAILWENDKPSRVRLSPIAEDKNHPVLVETERQLNDYFAGTRSGGHRVSKKGVGGAADNSFRRNAQLLADREADQESQSGARCRRCE